MTAFTTVTNGMTSDASQHMEAINALILNEYVAPLPGGRLTLTSGTPVTTADVATATSIYYTPYVHDRIMLWTGSKWQAYTFVETALALGTLTASLPYDVFGYVNAGALALEKLAWTNGTTRATGISLQDGRYCKTGDKTRLYLGTFYTVTTTTTEDSEANRLLWNMYNRVPRRCLKADTTSHTYTSTIRQWNNTAANQVTMVIGVQDSLGVMIHKSGMSGAAGGSTGLGIDTLAAYSQGNLNSFATDNPQYSSAIPSWAQMAVGYHYVALLETGAASVTFALASVMVQWVA